MDERQRHYLEVMGIQLWESRQAPVPDEVKGERLEVKGERRVEPPAPEQGIHELSEQPTVARVESKSPAEEVATDTKNLSPLTSDLLPAELDWDGLQQQVSQCTCCEELVANRTQTVFGVGNRNADWLIIGEAPGADEDKQGEPFVGRAGQLLNAMLAAIGLEREQVYIANILKCRPPNNRDPRPEEAAACSAFLQRQIALIQPKVVLALGRIAAQNLLHSEEPIGRLRGQVHRLENGLPLVVTYHPAYLLRSPLEKRKSWGDLCLARRVMQGSVQ